MKYFQLFILVLIGCGHKPKTPVKAKAIDRDAVRFAKFPSIARETDIQQLIGVINNSDCAYFGRIGYAGEENEVYDCYQRLLEIAPDSIWVKLSYNKNPILRIYASDALETRKSLYLRDVKKRLQKDTARFWHAAADMRMELSVGFFVSNSK